MGSDQETRMGVTFESWVTPEDGERPKRHRVPFDPAAVFNTMLDNLMRDGVVGVKDGRLIMADEMYIGQRPAEVTEEMDDAGMAFLRAEGVSDDEPTLVYLADAVYRAMHAVAPVELVSPAERQVEKAYCYLRGLFEVCAPNSTPLPDLIGLCTQIDNVIAGLRVQALPSDDRGNPFHFVMDRDGSGPQLWMRTALDDWFLVRPGWSLGREAPEVYAVATNAQPDRLPAGYRYLGPATWRRPAEPLVSDAEIALTRERDEARAELATLQGEAKLIAEELLRYADEDRTLRAELAAGDNELSRELSAANGRIAAMSAELMAAHDKLARFTAQNAEHTESTPDPIANAIRDHDTDRRRMGG